MKNKKRIILTAVIIVIIAIPAVWYFFPTTFLRGIEPSDVKSISLASGATGKKTVIDDPAEIKYIVENIQNVTMRKKSISKGKKGWHLSLEFYGSDGTKLDRFIIENDSIIRKDPFYYHSYSVSGKLCFYRLVDLVDKQPE